MALHRREVVRAVILAGTNSSNLLDLLDHKGLPSVLPGNNALGVPPDLVALGHRDIWFVGNTRLPWFGRCFDGYRRSMAAGRPSQQNSIGSEDDTEIGYLGTKSLLARREAGTAIFAGNDHTAHGVYKVLRDRGLRIPEDISVRRCDDTIGEWLRPELITIRDFPEQIGEADSESDLQSYCQTSPESAALYYPDRINQERFMPFVSSFPPK